MIYRCGNLNNPRYGGRGLKVCPRWRKSFSAFLEDMGERPSPKHKYSIHRVRNNRGYSKSNCIWATSAVQNRHQSTTKLTEAKANAIRTRYAAGGVLQRELALEYGVAIMTVSDIVRGATWAPETLATPIPKKPSTSVSVTAFESATKKVG